MDTLVRAADGNGYRVFSCFLVSDNQNVRIMHIVEAPDLQLHVDIFVIGFHTDPVFAQKIDNLLCILIMFRTDRNHRYLIRTCPEREASLEVFDHDTYEALHGSEDGTVNHDRLLQCSVLCGVLHVEVQRQLEVKLDRAHLPFSSQRVLHLQVNLRAVESTVAFIDLKVSFPVFLEQNCLQVRFRLVPHVDITHVIIRAGRKLCLIREAEGSVNLSRNIHNIGNFGCDLIFGNKNMRIILTELLYTEQTVQLAGFLLAVNNIDLCNAERQILVGSRLVHEYLDGIRAVHRLQSISITSVLCLAFQNKHAILIVSPVPGCNPQLLFGKNRTGNFLIAVLLMNPSPEFKQRIEKLPASRQPVRHSGSRGIEHEKFLLRADLLVIALLCFLNHVQMFLQFLFGRECININTLQHISVLVSAPVSAGYGFNLEGSA